MPTRPWLPSLLLAALSVTAIAGPQIDPTSSYAAQLVNPTLPAEQKEAAALWIAALKDRSQVDALIQALTERDQSVRRAVVLALERLGDPVAVPALIGRLLDRECHYQVQRALNRLDPSWRQRPQARSLFEALAEAMSAPDNRSLPGLEGPTWFALAPMIDLDPDRAAALFTQVLSTGGPPAQFLAGEMIRYLQERKWTAAEPALLVCLEHREGVVYEAANALGAFNPKWRRSDLAIGIARRLLERYRHTPNRETRNHLYEVLARIPLPEALPVLAHDLSPPGEASEQRYALRAVGQIGSPQALAVLRTYLEDTRVNQEMARECLLEIRDFRNEEARCILVQVLSDTRRDDELRELAGRLLLDCQEARDVEAVIREATTRGNSRSLRTDLLGAVVTGTKNVARGRFAGDEIDDIDLAVVRGRNCVRRLERQASDRREAFEVRESSIRVLRGVGDPLSFTALVSIAIDRTQGELRNEAVWALPHVDKSKALKAFWRLLEERKAGLPIIFMAWTLAEEGEQETRRLADRFGDLGEVKDTLVRRGRASLLPKEKAIEAITRLLGQEQWEHFYETLINQWVQLEGDTALAHLSQHGSPGVRAWAAYAGFRKQVVDSQSNASTGEEQESRP